MPLPPALAARLAKRGIAVPASTAAEPVASEEVIAEDYDDRVNVDSIKDAEYLTEKDISADIDITLKIKGYECCPNKYNIYHDCNSYCIKRYKDGIKEPDPKYLIKKQKMLEKYPVMEPWKEVFDRGTGRHYYWDMLNDLVSWFPPSHPKSEPSESAAALRESRILREGDESDDSATGSDNETEGKELEIHQKPKETFKRPLAKESSHRSNSYQGKKKPRHDNRLRNRDNDVIDPMDPAAYSDIPRGSWSAGLEGHSSEAKTGVDTTASGPLYQMRPYPSPGAILSANAKAKYAAEAKQTAEKSAVSFPEQPK